MALPSLLTESNFLYLSHLLKANPRETLSYLEYSWMLFNLSGNPDYTSAAHFEALVFWTGTRGRLVKALCVTGYLKRKGKLGYTVANPEKRLQDWAKKRIQRAEQAAADNGGQRRPHPAVVRPTDPDPVSSPKGKNIHIFDSGSQPPRPPASAKRSQSATPEGIKNPQQGVQATLSALQSSIRAVGDRPRRQGAPPPTQQVGSYSPTDCALWAASHDTGNDDDTARAMWITRAAELSQYTGGTEFFRDLISNVQSSRNAGLHKGVGRIHNVGAYLNAKTAQFLEQRKTA